MKLFAFILAVTLLMSVDVHAGNVFNCPGNGITPDFEHETSTLYMPHIFVGDTGIYRDVFIELNPVGNFDTGVYRILFGNNIPQSIKCSGFTQSNECPSLERLMCP